MKCPLCMGLEPGKLKVLVCAEVAVDIEASGQVSIPDLIDRDRVVFSNKRILMCDTCDVSSEESHILESLLKTMS